MSATGKHEEIELVPAINWNHWSRQQIQPGSLLNVYSPLVMLNITCQMNDPLTGLNTKAAVTLIFGRVITEDYTVQINPCLENSFFSHSWRFHTYLLAQEFPIFVCYQAIFWEHVVIFFNHCRQAKRQELIISPICLMQNCLKC